MGFNLYFAGAENLEIPLDENDDCGKLYTYAVGGKRLSKFIEGNKCKCFIDSGAFSMYHSGINIDIDEYIEYINNNPLPTIWAELDAIPYPVLNMKTGKESADKGWENYLYMMDRVKDEYRDKVIPIYHMGEPYEALERMINTEVHGRLAPYIGVGGRHGLGKTGHDKYYENLFKVIAKTKNPKVKIHAFGMTVIELLEKYPFYSADSTTWLMLGANGRIQTKCNGAVLVSDRAKGNLDSFYNLDKEIKSHIIDEIEEKGFKLEDLAANYRERHKFNAIYFKEWADNYKFKGNNGPRRKRLF